MDLKFIFLLVALTALWLLTRLVRKKKKLHNLLVVVFSIFLTLVLIETAYRFLLKKNPYLIHSSRNFGSYASHPLTGFMIAEPGPLQITKLTLTGDTIFNTTYTLLKDTGAAEIGMNHRVGYGDAAANDSAELVFLGCSITYGEGIGDTATFAWQTGKACQIPSQNYGFSGFGTHQAYSIFQHKYRRPVDHRRRSFVYTFIPDHILRAKCVYPWNINDPYYELEGDSLLLKGKATAVSNYAKAHKITRYLSLFNSFSFITDLETAIVTGKAARNLSTKDYDRTFAMLRDMTREAHESGDRFYLLYWDKYKWKEGDDESVLDRKLIEAKLAALEQQGLVIIRASEAFDQADPAYFIKGDGHPTAAANQRIAALLAKRICEAEPIKPGN